MKNAAAILVDTHYGTNLRGVTPLETAIVEHFGSSGQKWAKRSPLVRAMMAVWVGRKYDLVVTCQSWPGGKWIVLLHGLLGRRHVMLLEFILNPRRGLKALAYKVWFGWLLAPALRRSLRAAQVMADWEIPPYARTLKMPESTFRHVSWPLFDDWAEAKPAERTAGKVLSSGRAACDWETLFRAAEDTDWRLTVICGKADKGRVDRLNSGARAEVLCDVPPEEHEAHLRSSAVYVLALEEWTMSSGHVRLMRAISAGVPVVAAGVKGLEGYAIDGVTALVVPPGDAQALRAAVGRLLSDPAEARDLSRRALEFAKARTMSSYHDRLTEVVREVASEGAGDWARA